MPDMNDEVLNELWQAKEDIAAEHTHDIWALFAYFTSGALDPHAYTSTSTRHVAREDGIHESPGEDFR
jgi:hypothetical protein